MIKTGIHKSVIIECSGKLSMPESTILEPYSVIYAGDQASICLGEMNIFYPHCSIRIGKGYLKTGREVSFGPGCHIYEPRAGLEIGDYCLIAAGVLLCGVEHGYARLDIPMRHQPTKEEPIVIEENVWIGMGAIILPGVTIATGSIIGAGSVVTRSIPALSIANGVPCRVVRQRESSENMITNL